MNETEEICFVIPPVVNSMGIWENTASPSVILTYPLPLLELQILLTFFVSHLVYVILKPLGITFFAAQMFAGIILGPTTLGKLEAFEDVLVTSGFNSSFLDTAGVFGFAIFMFLMGVKMDVGVAFRTTKKALMIGIVSLLSSFVSGLIILGAFNNSDHSLEVKRERVMMATLESLASFSVIAVLLAELKLLNSELGRLALSSSTVNTIIHMILTYAITFLKRWLTSLAYALGHLVIMVLFVALVFFLFRPLMFWIIRKTPEGIPIKEVYIIGIIIVAIGCAIFTHWFHSSALYGAFLFGLAVPDGPPLGSALVDKFECFVNGVFLSVYVTTSTMYLHPDQMVFDNASLEFYFVFIIGTFLAKVISCYVALFRTMMSFRDSLAFSLIMSSKGIVELSFFTTSREKNKISETSYNVMAISILLKATLIPIMVKYLYDPVSRKYASHQKRNLMHLNPDVELRVLACIHGDENVPGLIEFLDHTCPTKESPIVIYALHLIELMGRDSPIFIVHEKQEDKVESSFKHILAFNQYEQNNEGLVTVNAFTAISPPRLMHEDITSMALDKQTSFLILPFHIIWSMDGSIVVENNAIRNLNCTVLDQALCSIGILVDRSMQCLKKKELKSSSYLIGMIFLGGKDDHEALTLAKRMARDPRVKLSVIHLIIDQEFNNVTDWDMMLDAEILKDIKQNDVNNDCDILYKEEVSNNGQETVSIVKSIAADYDLIIVGRRYGVDSIQTAGLSEWSEFPELGVIGDLLGSKDLTSSVSVLVVQQQHYVDVELD